MKTIYKDDTLMIKINGEQNCIYYKGMRCNLGDLQDNIKKLLNIGN